MMERALLWRFGAAADAALRPLGGTIVFQIRAGSPFELTLLGALLTSTGADLRRVFEACLTFVRDTYRGGSVAKSLPATHVQRGCRLTGRQLEALRLLLSRPEHRTDFIVRAPLGTKRSNLGWDLFVLDGVWRLRDVEDVPKYVAAWLMPGFDPSYPVRESEAQVSTPLPFDKPSETQRRLRQPEARYRKHAIEVLRMLQGRARLNALDLQILAESRFKPGVRTVKRRTFEDYLRKLRLDESTWQSLELGMHDAGRWSEAEEKTLQDALEEKDRHALTAGRRKHKKFRKY